MIKITPVGKTMKRLNNIRKHRRAFKKGISFALFDIGKVATTDISLLIQMGPRTDLFYRRPWGLHQASAPGEPPKEDFGELHQTTDYKVRGSQLEVGEIPPYGRTLELGMDRPHISVTEESIRGEAIEFLERRVQERVNKLV